MTVLFRALLADVADHYAIAVEDILGKTRLKTVAQARHVAMYVARERWDWSYPELGRRFHNGNPNGWRDHTTVMSACRKVARQRTEGGEVARLVDRLLRSEHRGEWLAKVPGEGLVLMEEAC